MSFKGGFKQWLWSQTADRLQRLRRCVPETMTGVVVIGGLAAATPLLIGMTMAGFALDRLATNTSTLLAHSITREYYSAQLRDKLTELRRSARQYSLRPDPALLAAVPARFAETEATLSNFETQGLSASAAPGIERLRRGLTAAAQAWSSPAPNAETLDDAMVRLQELTIEADAIIVAGRARATAELDRLSAEAQRARRMLVLLGLTLIPLTALLALSASFAVTRPLKDMGRGITALGNSRYDQPIRIEFPAEMRQLGEQLDWLRRKLAQLETDKDLFLRHVSHELKNPLATIKEGTALLREGSLGLLTPRQNEVAQILAESAVELGARITNLLNYAEWRADRRAANMDWFEVRPLVEETLAAQKLPMLRRTLATELDIQTPRLFGQRAQLRVALDNLVANAVKHSPKGATISIHAGISERRCRVWVRDRGPGVGAREGEKIFEPFVRGEQQDYSTPGTLPGSGIGLSVVRETVLAHGGTVRVEDAQPGARFTMEWPCAQAAK